MDKQQFRLMTERMLEYMKNKSYKDALDIAESIDWRKVKNANALCIAGEVYEHNGMFDKSKELLLQAYERTPDSKMVVYRLAIVALKSEDLKEALDCYHEFVKIAPKDANQYILLYKILKAMDAPISDQITALEDFKQREYIEKWAYELAVLYEKAGNLAACIEECDDLSLWFSEGKYVDKALELKMKYKPLTPLQRERYEGQKIKVDISESMMDTEITPEEETLVEKETPVQEEVSVEEEIPVQEEVPAEEETPVQEEVFVEEETPVQEEVFVEEETPVQEEVPVEEETPAEEEISAEEELPVQEEISVEEETIPEEEAPVQEEISVKEEAVPEEETPVEEEISAEEETVPEKEVPEEDPEEVEEKAMEALIKEVEKTAFSPKVQDILSDWEEKQKEHAQMIEQEKKKAEEEKSLAEEKEEEKEEILPDDIRKLIEELEGEDDLTPTWKDYVPTPQPAPVPVFETPVIEPTVEAVAEVYPNTTLNVQEEPENKPEPAPAEPVQEAEGIIVGDTQTIVMSAKAMDVQAGQNEAKQEVSEPVKEEKTDALSDASKYDTGFIVQGRYDLDARSEVGTKAGLTEEQKKLFSYFVPVHGMSEQIVDVLQNDKACKARYGTSRIGNIMIAGRPGSGKTVLAVDLIKAIQKQRRMKQGKVAIVTAESLNKKDVSEILKKLHGGALVIEKASRLKGRTIEDLCEVMEGQTGELLVVVEDERKSLEKLMAAYPKFHKKFTSRVTLPVFINDELVTFGQIYAKENGYRIDDMGILALYSSIDMMQREEKVVTVADIKEVVDDAIEHAKSMNIKKLVKKIFSKNKDESNKIILTEEDFKL